MAVRGVAGAQWFVRAVLVGAAGLLVALLLSLWSAPAYATDEAPVASEDAPSAAPDPEADDIVVAAVALDTADTARSAEQAAPEPTASEQDPVATVPEQAVPAADAPPAAEPATEQTPEAAASVPARVTAVIPVAAPAPAVTAVTAVPAPPVLVGPVAVDPPTVLKAPHPTSHSDLVTRPVAPARVLVPVAAPCLTVPAPVVPTTRPAWRGTPAPAPDGGLPTRDPMPVVAAPPSAEHLRSHLTRDDQRLRGEAAAGLPVVPRAGPPTGHGNASGLVPAALDPPQLRVLSTRAGPA